MCVSGGMSADSGCLVSEGGGSGDRDNGSMVDCGGSSDCRCRHSSVVAGDIGGGIEFGYKTIFLSKLIWLHLILFDGC
jgi:hypothetical protein